MTVPNTPAVEMPEIDFEEVPVKKSKKKKKKGAVEEVRYTTFKYKNAY